MYFTFFMFMTGFKTLLMYAISIRKFRLHCFFEFTKTNSGACEIKEILKYNFVSSCDIIASLYFSGEQRNAKQCQRHGISYAIQCRDIFVCSYRSRTARINDKE